MNGAVTYDGNVHCWITGNVLGLQGEMWFEDGSFKENKYLSDGTKMACMHDDGYESGLKYRGSMVYRIEWDEDLQESVERFESAVHPEGRFYAESFTPAGQPVLQSWHYVTDQIGSVLAVVDMDMVANGDEDAAIERNEYGAYGDRINHASFPKISGNRNRFNGKEEIDDTPGPYVDYGARIYSTAARQWLCPDPMADKYPDISPYVFCADDPVNIIDMFGRDTVAVIDASSRPNDNGTTGETYTATVFVIINGKIVGEYKGSSYPNSKSNTDNSTLYNTVKEGEYPYTNEFGHSASTKKGLNIVDNNGERNVPAETPDGEDTTATNINVHSGKSDKGNYNSRGSHGCITIRPDDAESFFSHFNWTNDNKTTGDSSGRILIYRNPIVKKMIKHEGIQVQ